MKRTVIINGRLILPDGQIEDGKVIFCQDGKIVSITNLKDYVFSVNDVVVDAEGHYVAPGFIDIHVHGGGGHDFMDGTVEAFLGAARAHAEHGTTSMIPTTLTCPDEELFRSFEVFREACRLNENGAQMLGMHLEGPYFNHKQAGAQDPLYLKNPTPEHYNEILEKGADVISRWSAAVELEGADGLGEALKEHGIVASIAHTDAVYDEIVEAHEAGFNLMTHFYSAMSSVTRRNARRYAGAVEAGYMLDDMSVEIIADGIHLPKPLLQFVYKFKGPKKTALCTDAMRGAGMPEGVYNLGSLEKGQPVIVEEGVAKLMDRSAFAGSVATADRLVRTMITLAEVPLADAVMMMTSTPARILGIQDSKGSLAEGLDADIVIFDENINIHKTIISGNVIYSSK
jgi:N-acetylglucosamine-6-phosphate deacetylase